MPDSHATALGAGAALLAAGEAALGRGDSEAAFELLERAARVGVEPRDLHRLATAFAQAGRYQSRHAEVLDWIEETLRSASDPAQRATMLRARVAAARQLDLKRVLDLAEEALDAAEAVGDEYAYAGVLSHAAFAAYRRGDAHAANQYAERAAGRAFTSRAAQYDALRAQLFASTARGELESTLNLTIKARALARELGRPADVSNESNNLAECYLDLGCPAEARACAEAAATLARQSGHRGVEGFAEVLAAIATAEAGDIDAALEQFDQVSANVHTRIFSVDTAAAHSFWLLERGAGGDAARARDIADRAIEQAHVTGVSHRLTSLYGNLARALARDSNLEGARDALEKARLAADRAEPGAQSLLALAVAEVLPVSEPRRKVVLNHARARILRIAERREDPHAFCNNVRLNRRLLELSGGVPSDLPHAQ
jgi:tetratricopeptide (TPR) repeat protein